MSLAEPDLDGVAFVKTEDSPNSVKCHSISRRKFYRKGCMHSPSQALQAMCLLQMSEAAQAPSVVATHEPFWSVQFPTLRQGPVQSAAVSATHLPSRREHSPRSLHFVEALQSRSLVTWHTPPAGEQ